MIMSNLIARLERATESGLELFEISRGLDGELALELGWKRGVGKGWARWTDPNGNTNRHVPFYTTSLDAKLPWENIIESRRLTVHRILVPDTWWAQHETQNGSILQGYGHTEVLARRIAALREKELS